MAHNQYLPTDDKGKTLWIKNFANKAPQYAAKYGITPDELADLAKGAVLFAAILEFKNELDEFVKKVTAYKNEMRDGNPDGAESIVPVPPSLNFSPTVANGIFKRAVSVANRIKQHIAYTVPDGQDMGLIGSEITTNTNVVCDFSAYPAAGGHVEIGWKKKGFTGIEIWVDRTGGTGKFELLAIDTIPNYIDKHPLPEAGKSEVWAYKAIYLKGDERVGQWSAVKTFTVTGTV